MNGGKVTITIAKPQKFPDSKDYYCCYNIAGIGNEKIKYAGGVDAIQALELALKQIGTDLYTSPHARAGDLHWFGSRNLGFPVPDTIKDLLPPKDDIQKGTPS
ncbi:MAG: hypothetical protein WDN72_02320 [Alphaproteobacteria bacterium]